MLVDSFIERAANIHHNKYQYDIGGGVVLLRDKITIICKDHGPFISRAHDHIHCKSGCPTCANVKKSKKKEFIQLANAHHNNKYGYERTKYTNNYTPVVITCPNHGDFSQVPSVHLSAVVGCVNCDAKQRSDSTEVFITKALVVHGDTYTYKDSKYKNRTSKVSIKCSHHGSFFQTPNNHLMGAGCPSCAHIKRTSKNNRTSWRSTEHITGILYVAEFFDENEQFIKIGITTSGGVYHRFGKSHQGYTIISTKEHTLPIEVAADTEQKTLAHFSNVGYTPIVKFGGYTECLQHCKKHDVLEFIQEQIE